MTVQIPTKNISPVNLEERQNLGIRSGDTVRVHQKIQEKGKTRIQIYEGLVIARKHGNEAGGTFTVRATHSGVGVERIFTLYSPLIDKIEIIRRAKLYYIRDKVAREIRRQLRNMKLMDASTESDREVKEREAAAAAEAEAAEKEAVEKAEAEKAAADSKQQSEDSNQQSETLTADESPTEEEAPAETPAEEVPEEKKEEKKEG
jgi:large subunit ribosomal protein L19